MAGRLAQILSDAASRARALEPQAAALEAAAAGAPPVRGLRDSLAGTALGVIAEVKRRSPSHGSINEELDPAVLAGAYAAGGASGISVLTDPVHFGGSLADLGAVRRAAPLPVLRKDFLLTELQLLEARAAGADAVLLIVRALDRSALATLLGTARCLGLDALVEVHTAAELEHALAAGAGIIGVNARDLDTFAIDTAAALAVLRSVPPGVLAVAESGITDASEVVRAADAGADAILVGTALARAADPASLVRALAAIPRRGR